MNITLTSEQVALIAKPIEDRLEQTLRDADAKAARAAATLQRRTEAKVDAANQRANEWKQRYQATRKNLLSAYAEITELKRRSRHFQGEQIAIDPEQ